MIGLAMGISAHASAAALTRTELEPGADAAATTEATESDLRDGPTSRPSPPPPVGVRFGEPLEGQRFRIAYRFDRLQHQGLLVGDRDTSPSQACSNPPNLCVRTPRSLEVTVHTFALSYAPHPRATLVVEVPFLLKELETVDTAGRRTQEQTRGVGDIVLAVVVPFIRKGNESSHFHIGFDIPTGSIRRGGDMTRLPFDSQIGNGTVDFEWGWTYRGRMDWLSWGGQAIGRHPLGRNGLQYREGSRFEASLWGAMRLPAGLSASLRLAWQKRNNTRVPERDLVTDPILDASDNPKARGGTRLIVSPGLTMELPQLGNQRVALEVGIPVHQDLDGPQLEQDWWVKAGWQWGF